jgi:pimeloyl-ACP methyl ester carboxylesterase
MLTVVLALVLLSPASAQQFSDSSAPVDLVSTANSSSSAGISTSAQPQEASVSCDDQEILSCDHFVSHTSTIPAYAGEQVRLFVRERVLRGIAETFRATRPTGRVILFVHGSTAPGEAAFDASSFDDYSVLAFMAQRNLDAFALDFTTYGRSREPEGTINSAFNPQDLYGPKVPLMNDKCNVPANSRPLIGPVTCAKGMPYPYQIRNMLSDLADLDEVVDYVRTLRGVDRIHMVGWSTGGRITGQYAIAHPEKVDRLALVAPTYNPDPAAFPPPPLKPDGTFDLPRPLRRLANGSVAPTVGSVLVTDKASGLSGWNGQVQCEGQVEPGVQDAVWNEFQATDPLGALWGVGVLRFTAVTNWDWNRLTVPWIMAPTLLVTGLLDNVVPTATVTTLFNDMAAESRVLLEVECAGHQIWFEKQRRVLRESILEWLLTGHVRGLDCGTARASEDGEIHRLARCLPD